MLNTVKRSIQLGKIGLAAKRVANASDEKQKDIARKALANLFANSRGVMMKVGQLLADSDNSPYRKLLDNIEPYTLEYILPYLEDSLGKPVSQVFQSIEEASAAASLGQVHKAILHTGETVAVKIQYPEIGEAVDAELRLAGLLPGVGPVKKWGFDLESYKQELKANMSRELDYLSEAKRQQKFAEQVSIEGLTIPRIYMEYCSEKVLVQDWEPGLSINDISNWSSEVRQEIARILIKTLFKSLFVVGEIHGDPHIGNSFYRKNRSGKPNVVLLDYGCTVPIDKNARMALLKLIVSLKEGLEVSPLQCFSAMGFDAKKLSYIDSALPMLSTILLRPFLVDGRMKLSDWHLQKDLDSLLGEKRWWFRSAGPANLFLLIRAFQGLVQNLDYIKSFSSWSDLLYESLGPELIQQARDYTLPDLDSDALVHSISTSALAKELKVSVWNNKQKSVGVSMPASAVLELEDIMPEDVYLQLKQSSDINLELIMQKVKDSGIAPQTVFDYEVGSKRYKVWLE